MRYLARKKIGMIGLGNMGHAILRGLISSGAAGPSAIRGYDCDDAKARSAKRELKVRLEDSVAGLARRSDVIIIAVKPQNIREVLGELSSEAKGKLIISIAAGIKTSVIEGALGGRPRVIRVMPNTPALVGEGMSVVCKGKYAKRADVRPRMRYSAVSARHWR